MEGSGKKFGPAHQQSVNQIGRIFSERLKSGQFDDLTVKEVRTRAVQEVEQLLNHDANASAVSIIAWIILADAPDLESPVE